MGRRDFAVRGEGVVLALLLGLTLAGAPPAATTSAPVEEPAAPATAYSLPPMSITPSPPPPSRPDRPSVITSPDWLRLPDGSDLERYYPAGAKEFGVEGRATVDCQVTAAGTLIDCRVVSEEPADAGFGGATLRLTSRFKMRPLTKDGVSVDGAHVVVPVRWRLADDELPQRPLDLAPGLLQDYSIWLSAQALAFASKAHRSPCTSAQVIWSQAPTPVVRAQLPTYMKPRPAKAYLERLSIRGCGEITTRVLVVWLDANGHWQARDFPKGEALMPAYVPVPVPVPMPVPAPPPLIIQTTRPEDVRPHRAPSPVTVPTLWLKVPTQAQRDAVYPVVARANGVAGAAALDCAVRPDGALEDCKVTAETPSGLGFGTAALRLTWSYRVRPGTGSGRRVTVMLFWPKP
jgi:TonB family protein